MGFRNIVNNPFPRRDRSVSARPHRFDARLLFPAWLERGPWPYEAGVMLLLVWLSECARHITETRASYAPGFRLADALVDHGGLFAVVCLFGAAMLLVGLSLVIFRSEHAARWFRVAGMLTAASVFGVLAVGFHAAWTYSLGGGAYLFLTWRSLCVASRLARQGVDNGPG
jgi:hypothetical protein